MSRSFTKSTWLPQLQAVHRWAWQKWDLVRAARPLDDRSSKQEPAVIFADVVQELQPIISAMGERNKYGL